LRELEGGCKAVVPLKKLSSHISNCPHGHQNEINWRRQERELKAYIIELKEECQGWKRRANILNQQIVTINRNQQLEKKDEGKKK